MIIYTPTTSLCMTLRDKGLLNPFTSLSYGRLIWRRYTPEVPCPHQGAALCEPLSGMKHK